MSRKTLSRKTLFGKALSGSGRHRFARRSATAGAMSLFVLLALVPGQASASACSDSCRVEAAHSYIRALVTHDSSDVALHPRATRVEQGLQTGYSGRQLRADLAHGPQYRVIGGVHDVRDTVVDGVVHTDYALDIGIGDARLTTVRVRETFTYDDAAIRTITAHISPSEPATAA